MFLKTLQLEKPLQGKCINSDQFAGVEWLCHHCLYTINKTHMRTKCDGSSGNKLWEETGSGYANFLSRWMTLTVERIRIQDNFNFLSKSGLIWAAGERSWGLGEIVADVNCVSQFEINSFVCFRSPEFVLTNYCLGTDLFWKKNVLIRKVGWRLKQISSCLEHMICIDLWNPALQDVLVY